MLSWTQRPDGWHANGYHIELAAPFRWVLTQDVPEARAEAAIGYVSTPPAPLATARTLTEAKREAEIHDSTQYRAAKRRRHGAMLLLIVASGALVMGDSPLTNLAVLLVIAYLAIRSIGVIVGTWLWRLSGISHGQYFYQ